MPARPDNAPAWWGAALLLSLPALLFPIYNPDLFWHLAAGRWILEARALPREDLFSFTAAGRPWADFEWLSQVVFQGAHSAGGFAGLWALKGLLLAAGWLPLAAILRLHGFSAPVRAAAFAFWSAGTMGHSDIRPELFSLLFFALVLLALEAARLGRLRLGPSSWAAAAALFSLWASLHAGFFLAFVLIAAYAAAALARGERREGARFAALGLAGAAGSLANPYGAGPHLVAWEHWLMRSELTLTIKEWGPLTARNPIHWPLWALLALAAVLVAALATRAALSWRRWPWAPLLAGLYLAWGALNHTRLASYFNAVGVVLCALLAKELGWLAAGRPWRRVLAGGLAAYAAYLCLAVPRIVWSRPFNDKYVPSRAAEFMAAEREALGGLRLYNQWEWGGYLSWRLGPGHKVFGDGRYIFHDHLRELREASAEAGAWQDLMRRRGLDGALMADIKVAFPTTKLYPDGSKRVFRRPWYLFYMPLDRWALVYWDEKALLFVARSAASASWLKAHEYRFLRPGDEEARAEALARGEIRRESVAAEAERHARELAAADAGLRKDG